MTYAPVKSAGTKILISATPSASATTEILGVKTIPEFGAEYAAIDQTTLRDTAKVNGKSGMADYGEIQLEGLASPSGDTGQGLLATAAAYNGTYNFEIQLTDGATSPTKYAFAAYVRSYRVTPGGGNDDDVKFKATLAVAGAITKTAAV